MRIIFTLLSAIVGACSAAKLKWPAAPMIGALVSVSVFNIFTGFASIPVEVKVLTQIIAGIFIGSRITKKDLMQLRKMVGPVVFALGTLIGFCLLMGYGIYLGSDVNLPTGLLSTAPGGLVDITLISEDLGAAPATVSVFQITRLFSVLALFPLLLKSVILNQPDDFSQNEVIAPSSQSKENKVNLLLTLAVAMLSGFIGKMTQIPAGTLIFSMIGCSTLNILFNRTYMPKIIRSGAQTCAGALIGSSVTLSAILELKTCLLPALLMIGGYFILNIGLAFLLKRFANIDFVTAFFACAPGGATDMTLMSGDFGANVAWVSVFQIIRSVSIIVIYPFIVMLFTS